MEVGIDTISFAAEQFKEKTDPFVITAKPSFALDVCRAMTSENEVGESRLTKFMDDCIREAINRGSTALDYKL